MPLFRIARRDAGDERCGGGGSPAAAAATTGGRPCTQQAEDGGITGCRPYNRRSRCDQAGGCPAKEKIHSAPAPTEIPVRQINDNVAEAKRASTASLAARSRIRASCASTTPCTFRGIHTTVRRGRAGDGFEGRAVAVAVPGAAEGLGGGGVVGHRGEPAGPFYAPRRRGRGGDHGGRHRTAPGAGEGRGAEQLGESVEREKVDRHEAVGGGGGESTPGVHADGQD